VRIGGFVPVSLCDFPGKVAAVVFTQGCNFRCPICHNGHLLERHADVLLDEDEVLTRLQDRRRHLDGVVVTGGEPTVQPDLVHFLCRLRACGLAVKLDTNGSHPEVLQTLLEARLLDYVAMDIKAPWDRYDRLAGVACDTWRLQRSMRLVAQSGVPHEFRTTRAEMLLSESDCERLLGQIPFGSPHKWQRFRPEYSLDEALRPPGTGVPDLRGVKV
jgi:pyruvate formate lyase activating enzyme